jgi:hypothetical protein
MGQGRSVERRAARAGRNPMRLVVPSALPEKPRPPRVSLPVGRGDRWCRYLRMLVSTEPSTVRAGSTASSRTHQEGEGQRIGIRHGDNPETCPVRALRAWLDAARLSAGPVFRSVTRHRGVRASLSAKAVALIVKRAAVALDWTPLATPATASARGSPPAPAPEARTSLRS